MTSTFRKRISRSVISSLVPFLKGEDFNVLHRAIPLSIKLCKVKNDGPQFELSFKELIKLKPELEPLVHPVSLYNCLKNQCSERGITDILLQEDSCHKYIFSVNQFDFNRQLLFKTSREIEDILDQSCLFYNIPSSRIIVEFSSPNIAKPFHYGHFRSTIVGNFLVNLFKYVGHHVTAINYIGDWGLQYGILATGLKQFGIQEELEKDPFNHLQKIYTEANEKNKQDPEFSEAARKHFQQMEQRNTDVLNQWRYFRDLSLKKMKETYNRLNIHFDEFHGESDYVDKTNDVFEELLQKNIAVQESDGSIQSTLFDDSPDKTVLKKSDGTTLYLSRDVAAAISRYQNFHFDSMYYVVDSSQSKHFMQLFSIIKAMDHSWHSDLHHIPFGRISNFSSRKGNAVFLHDILDEAQARTLESLKQSPTTKITQDFEKVADILGISALIVHDLSKRRKKEYAFDWERVLNFTSDSGITLQYCHARLHSLKKNCGVQLKPPFDFNYLTEPEAYELIHVIARFEEILYTTYIELEPCILVHYLFQLTKAINKANKVLTVKGQDLFVAKARLFLFHTAQVVLAKGLKIIGIQPLDEM